MYKKVNALVLREVKYKEADRILTLMTDTDGKLTVKARGALRKSSQISAATEHLKYSEMLLFVNRGRWSVNEATVKEGFEALTEDIEALALACYFSECVEAISVEEQEDLPMLQLALNSLYALSRGIYPSEHIKAVFEMRLMCLAGYTPEFSSCSVCGKTELEKPMLCLDKGTVCCRDCLHTAVRAIKLDRASLSAVKHICTASAKQIMSFKLEDTSLRTLSLATEAYLLTYTERLFTTLDYWKKFKNRTV